MNGVTYNQLIVFHAIAAEKSISLAAKKLQITAPSVSHSLKLLEQQVGLPLFLRTTRRVELTEAGLALQQKTSALLLQLDYAFESVSALNQAPKGKIRITVPRFVYQLILEPIYIDFCRAYPQIQLEISISDEAIDILQQGFDIGIRFGHKISDSMVARQLTPVYKEALFASKAYLQHFGAPKIIADLKQHRLIQYRFISSNQLAPLVLLDEKQKVTVDMPIALIVNDTDLMLNASLKGLGIGRLLTPLAQPYFASGELVPVLAPYWSEYSALYVYFHKEAAKAKRIRVFVDFLLNAKIDLDAK